MSARSAERELAARSPAAARRIIRDGSFEGPTASLAAGHLQATVAILPESRALDFALYCQRNPKTLPLIGMTAPGARDCPALAADLDLAQDLPAYRIFEAGVLQEETGAVDAHWRGDLVAFLFGTAQGFEPALAEAGLELRHRTEAHAPPLYETNVPMAASRHFGGRLWVSMRPFSPADAIRAIEIASRYPLAHGAPVHIGDPEAIGIERLNAPDGGTASRLRAGEMPVFWPSTRTLEAALVAARAPFAILNAPGRLLITDWERERARG